MPAQPPENICDWDLDRLIDWAYQEGLSETARKALIAQWFAECRPGASRAERREAYARAGVAIGKW